MCREVWSTILLSTTENPMKNKAIHAVKRLRPVRLNPVVSRLLEDEAISGKLIIGAVILALVAVNSPLKNVYDSLLGIHLNVGLGSFGLDYDLRHWINDGLMTLFFLVVGLELRRELSHGELKEFKTAALPFAAALGGMLLPAFIFAVLNNGKDSMSGWAIPIATDIALALGVLALLGNRVPSTLRLFLLTLAIVDDIIAVIIIALFYTDNLNTVMILCGAIWIAIMMAITKYRLMTTWLFISMAVIFWLILNASGVHPTIAGAIIGLIAPLALMKKQRQSIGHRLEAATIPVSTLIVVPLFAFANTGVAVSLASFDSGVAAYLSLGIILGLVLGKSIGILLAAWLMVRFAKLELPKGVNWTHILGVGLLAGIGFTVSIFVTELAYVGSTYIDLSKISIFIASIISAILGLLVLYYSTRRHKA